MLCIAVTKIRTKMIEKFSIITILMLLTFLLESTHQIESHEEFFDSRNHTIVEYCLDCYRNHDKLRIPFVTCVADLETHKQECTPNLYDVLDRQVLKKESWSVKGANCENSLDTKFVFLGLNFIDRTTIGKCKPNERAEEMVEVNIYRHENNEFRSLDYWNENTKWFIVAYENYFDVFSTSSESTSFLMYLNDYFANFDFWNGSSKENLVDIHEFNEIHPLKMADPRDEKNDHNKKSLRTYIVISKNYSLISIYQNSYSEPSDFHLRDYFDLKNSDISSPEDIQVRASKSNSLVFLTSIKEKKTQLLTITSLKFEMGKTLKLNEDVKKVKIHFSRSHEELYLLELVGECNAVYSQKLDMMGNKIGEKQLILILGKEDDCIIEDFSVMESLTKSDKNLISHFVYTCKKHVSLNAEKSDDYLFLKVEHLPENKFTLNLNFPENPETQTENIIVN